MAEYAISAGIEEEPALKWWVSNVTRTTTKEPISLDSKCLKQLKMPLGYMRSIVMTVRQL